MKKIWILSVAAVLSLTAAHAQSDKSETKEMKKARREALKKLPGTGISVDVKQAFAGDFGNPEVTWQRTDVFDIADFTSNNVAMTAYYDADAHLVGTVVHKTFADLPAKAQQTINAQYASYTKGAVVFYDDNENNPTDMILYDLQFDDMDSYFVEVTRGGSTTILQVTMGGDVAVFTTKK